MSPSLRARTWLVVLAALACVQLAPSCELPSDPPTASIQLENVSVLENPDGSYQASLDVRVDTSETFQSYELTLAWDADALDCYQAVPHPDFDDDGQLAVTPVVTSESIGPIVDLRHGPPVTGSTRVVTLSFVAPDGMPTSISVSGRAARPDGTLLSMAPSDTVDLP